MDNQRRATDLVSAPPAIRAILACFNRSQLTERTVRNVLLDESVTAYIFDDGSTDGTAGVLAAHYPRVKRLQGFGSSFWATGMACAEAMALGEAKPEDYILWLNDDVDLVPGAIARAVESAQAAPDSIIVGATRSSTGKTTYSAMKRGRFRRLRFTRIPPQTRNARIDTFNGNFVLVPADIAVRIGGIDGRFSHSLADIDYGLRARQLGINIVLLPEYVGICERNLPPSGSVRHRWRTFVGPKGGGNLPSLTRLARRHIGRGWAAYVTAVYGAWALRALIPRRNG